MRSRVHVLVPAYGPSPFLSWTLDSVLAAADDHTRVTVLDDGTPGPDVLSITAAFEGRLEYLRSPTNRGVAGSFQACVDYSGGDYTVIMGSDDLMEPWYVEEINSLAKEFSEPAMLLPAVTVVDSSGTVVTPLADRVKGWLAPRGRRQLLGGEALATRLLLGNFLYFPAMAWRTDLLRRYGFREDLETVLDLDLEMRLVFDGEQLAWSPRRSFRYRRHSASASSITAAAGGRFDEEAAVYAWSIEAAEARGWRRARRAAQLHPASRLHATLAGLQRARRRASGGLIRA
jgi:glycosyltransferase involved in cell wall biosynthesis